MELSPTINILENENRREFAGKLVRANEEGSVLMMTEQVFASVEHTQLHKVSTPHELTTLKLSFQEMQKGLAIGDPDMMSRAEFRISQELHFWRLSLAERDLRVGTFDLRSFIEKTGSTLNIQVLAVLARFYRNLMPTSAVQSKYDYVLTKMFTREDGTGKRILRIGRDSLVQHLADLVAEWTELSNHRRIYETAKIVEIVAAFNSFIITAKSKRTMEEFAKMEIFNQIRKFKVGLGEIFYAPEVTAASIECNIEVGNKFATLLAAEQKNFCDSTKFGIGLIETLQDFAINQNSRTMEILAQVAVEEATINSGAEESTGFQITDIAVQLEQNAAQDKRNRIHGRNVIPATVRESFDSSPHLSAETSEVVALSAPENSPAGKLPATEEPSQLTIFDKVKETTPKTATTSEAETLPENGGYQDLRSTNSLNNDDEEWAEIISDETAPETPNLPAALSNLSLAVTDKTPAVNLPLDLQKELNLPVSASESDTFDSLPEHSDNAENQVCAVNEFSGESPEEPANLSMFLESETNNAIEEPELPDFLGQNFSPDNPETPENWLAAKLAETAETHGENVNQSAVDNREISVETDFPAEPDVTTELPEDLALQQLLEKLKREDEILAADTAPGAIGETPDFDEEPETNINEELGDFPEIIGEADETVSNFDETAFNAAIEELARFEPNHDVLSKYLENSPTLEVREIDLAAFLPAKTGEQSESAFTEKDLRRRILTLVLQADGFLQKCFAPAAVHGEIEKAEIELLLEDMQTQGILLRNLTREISGEDKNERVNQLLYVANQLLEARLRLNTAQVRRNMNERAAQIFAAQAAAQTQRIHFDLTSESTPAAQKSSALQKKTWSNSLSNLLDVNIWLLLTTLIVTAISFGIYFLANNQEDQIKVNRAGVVSVDPKLMLGGSHIATAKISSETLICFVNEEWTNASENERREDLKKLLSNGSQKNFSSVLLINHNGAIVGRASATDINPSSN